MTRAQTLAKSLRQIVVIFWLLGIFATIGYMMGILSALSGEADNGVLIITLIVQLFAVWIGLAWMGLLAQGVAELLAPSSPE